ncbi:MAG: glycosyltransferase family 9 protein [Ignavibacteriaceae bacterium]|nr:glycosyltransferase family 9 protein [Ignavibacteriaceae bacterium]
MKRILLVRTDRVGDVVFITPMIRELRKKYPDAFIATLTRLHTKNIMLNNPHLDLALTDDLSKESFWDVVKELRKYKFNYGLLMMPTERAAYQMFWAGIKTRIGVGHKLYEIITGMRSVSRNNYTPLRHEADYCMDLARKIGVETDDITLEIFLSEKEKAEAAALLEKFGVEQNDLKIMIHTGSLGSAPNWSERKYFNLIQRIFKEFNSDNLKIILTASEMSMDFLRELDKFEEGKIINLSREFDDLRDFIKVIGQADVFMGPSTGPLHISDALGKKTIVIHCHRAMNCPKHQGMINKYSINLEVSEENCKRYCSADQNTCGIENGLGIDEVINAMKKLLKR